MSKIIQFLREVREVFQSISWGKREALIQLTIVVISLSVATSLILGGFDLLFTNSFNFLSSLKNPKTVQINPSDIQIGVTPLPATPSASIISPTVTNNKK